MARKAAAFTQADVTKAVKAVTAAGAEVSKVKITASGMIVVVTGKPTERPEPASNAVAPIEQDDLDRELEEWGKRHEG